MHPDQEEVLYVVFGRFEQWVDREMRILGPGDSAFVPPGVVHASFPVGDTPAQLLAIFGPCVGDRGFTTVEMANESPWSGLRTSPAARP
jgi:quercetin dioxygenase-like cupin family protein